MNTAFPSAAVALCLFTTPWAWADPENESYTGAALGFTVDSDTDGHHEVLAKLTVRGNAQLHKPADQLRLTIGVITENNDATTAMEANARLMRGQLPDAHVSPTLQGSPSSHDTPSTLAGFEHCPVPGSHAPASWH